MLSRSIAIMCLFYLASCKNSDSWMGKQWHNTTAHYNTYFNANEKWNETVTTMRENNPDDFRTFLEIYNIGSQEGLKANLGAMDEIVKKVSTMIDRHPRSKWVDDAYLLMAKAYFMKGDFNAAADLCEFINGNYKDPEVVYTSRLWIFRTLYHQKKFVEAENLLKGLKADKNFPKTLSGELNLALGATALKLQKYKQAAELLEQALQKANGKLNRYRLHYILGQIYLEQKNYAPAADHFSKVIKMNPPYELAFNARTTLTEILALRGGSYSKVNHILKRMLRDDKNIDYYGQIYYRLGLNELSAGNSAKAISYFNTSLRKSTGNNAQLTTTYLALGDYFYSNRNFEYAGLYYDSANQKLDDKHPNYKNLSQKTLQLSDLLRNLITIKKEDSLLRLSNDPELREKTIDKLIAAEKKRLEEQKRNNLSPPAPVVNPGATGTTGTTGASSFPFYNTAMRLKGQQDFNAYWGNRTNRDYWRINAKKSSPAADKSDDTTAASASKDSIPKGAGIPENISADRKIYYKDIPLTKEARQNSESKIEDALFAAAGIYQNQLLEDAEAIKLYNELLKRYPKTKYEAQTLFELAKLYRNAGNNSAYIEKLAALKTKYPSSHYIGLLDNSGATQTTNENTSEQKIIEDIYDSVYTLFKNGKYAAAAALKLETDRKYAGNALQSRFDYLYALCLYHQGNAAKSLELLNQVVSDYPSTAIADMAQANIDAMKRLQEKTGSSASVDTASTKSGELWKDWDNKEELFFIMSFAKGTNTSMIRAALNDFNKENFVFETLEVSSSRASGETVYISVANFSKPAVALDYLKMLQTKADLFASKGLFEYELAWICKTNYTTLAGNNRINAYMDYFKSKTK